MKSPEALKTIGEVAKIVNVPIYVLRFWEKKINLIAPIKKKNGKRLIETKFTNNIMGEKYFNYLNKVFYD